MRLQLLIGLVACVHAFSLSARTEDQDTTALHPVRLAIVSGVTLGTIVGVHIYQHNAWWQGQRAPFRFENDWDYALNIDKFGHAYGAYLLSHLFGYGLRWSGLSRLQSVFYGSLFGLGYQLYVEVEDGYHRDYGFSPGDAIADVTGAMIPLMQEAIPPLQSFCLKWSYAPSSEYENALKSGQNRVFIDDYQGQKYWISWTPSMVFGTGTPRWLPDWLGIAGGLGARDLESASDRRIIGAVTLDVNLARVRTGSDFADGILTALNHIHLPMPGVLIDRSTVNVRFVY